MGLFDGLTTGIRDKIDIIWLWLSHDRADKASVERSLDETVALLETEITKQVREARRDELGLAVLQFIFNTRGNPNNFSEYATHRLRELSNNKREEMPS